MAQRLGLLFGWVVGGLLSVACSGATGGPSAEPDAGVELTCDDVLDEASRLDTELAAEFASPCAVDEDCALDPGYVDCPDATSTLDTSEIAYARSRSTEYEAARERYLPLCAHGCAFHLDEFYREARCDDGVCRGSALDSERFCASALRRIAELSTMSEGDAWRVCEVAEDCVLVSTAVDCELRSTFEGCPAPLRADATSAFHAALLDVTARYCEEPSTDCHEVALCEPAVPDCVAGRCAAVPVDGGG